MLHFDIQIALFGHRDLEEILIGHVADEAAVGLPRCEGIRGGIAVVRLRLPPVGLRLADAQVIFHVLHRVERIAARDLDVIRAGLHADLRQRRFGDRALDARIIDLLQTIREAVDREIPVGGGVLEVFVLHFDIQIAFLGDREPEEVPVVDFPDEAAVGLPQREGIRGGIIAVRLAFPAVGPREIAGQPVFHVLHRVERIAARDLDVIRAGLHADLRQRRFGDRALDARIIDLLQTIREAVDREIPVGGGVLEIRVRDAQGEITAFGRRNLIVIYIV